MDLCTDSKLLFDIISKGTRTSEKQIMLDIHEGHEGYRKRDISNIRFVRSSAYLADWPTKEKVEKDLLNLLKSGKHIVQCEQWILR